MGAQICRTFHFGAEGGTSAGQFNAYLKSIRLNSEVIDWEAEDLRCGHSVACDWCWRA